MTPNTEPIETIRVTLRDADMRDFLAETSNVDEAIRQYCQAYANLIKRDYPQADVTVESGETNGGTFIYINDEKFGTAGSYRLDDLGAYDGAPERIAYLAEELTQDWDWLTVA
jgi:hypothetical protein